jgi:hypothetical protein
MTYNSGDISSSETQQQRGVVDVQIAISIFLSISIAMFLVDVGRIFVNCSRGTFSALSNRRREAEYFHQLRVKRSLYLNCLVFINNVFNIVTFSLVAVTAFEIPFSGGNSRCDGIVLSYTFGYILSFETGFVLLIFRNSFVEELQQSRMYRTVVWATKICLLLFIPLFTIPCVIIYFRGQVVSTTLSSDKICLQVNETLWFTLVFLSGIVMLSMISTYLFVAPLRIKLDRVRILSQQQFNHVQYVRRLMVRNLILNFIAMANTIVDISLYTSYNHGGPNVEDVLFSLIFPAMDLLVFGICIRLMLVDERKCRFAFQVVMEKLNLRKKKKKKFAPAPFASNPHRENQTSPSGLATLAGRPPTVVASIVGT